jgi:hypothetical protein
MCSELQQTAEEFRKKALDRWDNEGGAEGAIEDPRVTPDPSPANSDSSKASAEGESFASKRTGVAIPVDRRAKLALTHF